MKKTLQTLRLGFAVALPVAGWLAYRSISQNPGQPTGVYCLYIFLILTIILLIWVAHCALLCEPQDDGLVDVACVWRCWRRFLIIEAILLLLLFACLFGAHFP